MGLRKRTNTMRRSLLYVTLAVVVTAEASGADPEGCLNCHRYRGLARLDPRDTSLHVYYVDPNYYEHILGPHARLRCTDCHERAEVEVVPHRTTTPVDCTRQCHIVPLAGVELPFSHKGVQERLHNSAHAPEKLANLPLDPPLLRAGQSPCLYCHDQPLFRRPLGRFAGMRWAYGNTRCDTCHAEELPVNIAYHIHHVTSRLQPTRPVRQFAQVCAVCHSDPAVIAQTGSHDTVASYLHSFHGKASLLGSTQTATCVDCHASETGDAHEMRSKDDPSSSTHPAQLPITCRTIQCHPGAPPGMSRAAVHLNLDPRARTLEFYVAAMFVSLTAGVMIVFFILIMLGLLNTMVRRWDPEHARLIRLADKLKEMPEGCKLLERLTIHQRIQHWVMAVVFIVLVATGMCLKFAEAEWAPKLISLFGGLPMARNLHRIGGIVLLAVFGYHLIYLAFRFVGHIRRARRQGSTERIWEMVFSSPIVMRWSDIREFGQMFAYLLFFRRRAPRFQRFNFTQKFEYWAVFWGMPVMGFTGLALWVASGLSEHVSGRWLNFAFIIHSDEAYLAFIYIAVVHMFSIVFTPSVFPLSPGTITGQAPSEELAEGHGEMVDTVAQELGVSVEVPARPQLTAGRFVKQAIRRTDPDNSCTASGCHAPLPHGRRIEVRAYLNMHSTFLDCAVCHADEVDQAEHTRWYALPQRTPRTTPPAVLQLASLLENMGEATTKQATAVHEQLITLLGEAITESGGNPQLRHWLSQLDIASTRSKLWQSLLSDIRRGIPMHVHGEYNAKIALGKGKEPFGKPTDEQRAATKRYLKDKATASPEQQKLLLTIIHKGTKSAGVLCTPCHSEQPTLMDFVALGYTPNRAQSLQSSEIVPQVLSIERGQPFYLPRILEGGGGR